MRISRITITDWKSFDHATLNLDQINIIVGRNNSGKSAILKAIQLLQPGGTSVTEGEIRLGAQNASIEYILNDFDVPRYASMLSSEKQIVSIAINGVIAQVSAHVDVSRQIGGLASVGQRLSISDHQWGGLPEISPKEPGNFIYPYLSKRKVPSYDRNVDIQRASQVSGNLAQLPAKVARLGVPGFYGSDEFAQLCERLLGIRLGAIPVENGQLVGFTVGKLGSITIDSMGEGVASILGLITDLCVAENQLFLIEEPENDIHPQGLKSLLDAIVEKSAANQFIVSTHSNIVVKHLASAPASRLFSVEQASHNREIPTSTIREVKSPEARTQVLRDLGYELYDFDLWEGWLFLEESSAELVIRHLIPWFAPRLSRVRTVAAGGTSKVEPTFEDFRRLFLFAHLEPQYKNRAWVIVDGDAAGDEVIKSLKANYKSWPVGHFRSWQKGNFEEYYPAQFQDAARAALALPHDQKRSPKAQLTKAVDKWCRENPEEAKAAFEESAAEIISVLQEIETDLFGAG
ncbi:ATP-dependent nuclease [Kitasatospora purpeofusca]|uniref:ATP-dependent nuclease n=1 Tax=Kitasatospora purpeofusca TaxID=67352 RepID=UPI003867053F